MRFRLREMRRNVAVERMGHGRRDRDLRRGPSGGAPRCRQAPVGQSAALTLDESGNAFARSASRMRALRPRAYGFRRALDQLATSGISRREAADGSFVFVRLALMGGRLTGADDPEEVARFQLNIPRRNLPVVGTCEFAAGDLDPDPDPDLDLDLDPDPDLDLDLDPVTRRTSPSSASPPPDTPPRPPPRP
jgi:hypothetical protein